jgi:hypothetical protein
MKKIVLALTATAALATAMPAAAQIYGGSLREVNNREARLDQQISWGAQRGNLTRYEVRDLRMKLNEVEQLERYYARTGGYVSRQEVAVLNRKLSGIEYLIRVNMRDGDRRYGDGRYGDGRYGDGRWNDRNGDGYPDRW